MAINYPNGKPFVYDESKKKKTQTKKSIVEFGKRGMRFEEAINESNAYYLNHALAVIHKKPTPIQIVSVDYPRRSAAVIKEAYFRQASTTDYNGVYQGYYIDFEAKETQNKTSFPLKNFHAHQIEHMQKCRASHGICFVLLWFSSTQRCFLLGIEELAYFWDSQNHTKVKSIPLKQIESQGIEIIPNVAPRIPYFEAVDRYIQELKQKGAL